MGASEFVCMKDTAVDELWQLRYFQHWLDTLNAAHEMLYNPPRNCRHGECSSCETAARSVLHRLGVRPGALLDLNTIFGPTADVFGVSAHGHIDVVKARQMVMASIAAIPNFSSLL
jgi:hypothetical protein